MFTAAKPIFIKGKSCETNFQAGFVCRFDASERKKYALKMAASTFCRVTLNGAFLHYGPARGPHGYLRVDEITIPAVPGENLLTFEVAGYNCPSFYTVDVPSFLQCEICEDGEAIAWTGRDFKGISLDAFREPKVSRYSFQRAFTEVYYLDSEATGWTKGDFEGEALEIADPGLAYIPRGFKVPEFKVTSAAKPVRSGVYTLKNSERHYCRNHIPSPEVKCFRYDELPNDVIGATDAEFIEREIGSSISAGQFRQFTFDGIDTGFIMTRLSVVSPAVVYVIFAEKYKPGTLDIKSGDASSDTLNVIKYRLPVGEYSLESFECYSLKHIALLVESGEVENCGFRLREYCYPILDIAVNTGDATLDRTFEACRQSFRQNTVDCFMDCPGRERGGWLCDSYFTGMASLLFTGDTECERHFLDNFRIAKYPENGLPRGLLPMCYPGDNVWDSTIPQWTMWYVMEVGAFGKRGGDASRYKEIIEQIIGFFEGYENPDGMLEKLPYWNFVEWTKANDWVQDVSYPTNMLYTGVLRTAAEILGRPELCEKADKVRDRIIEQSFDGEYFRDHAVRMPDGTLEVLNDRSDICQHEALMFDIFSPADERFAVLMESIRNRFGVLGDRSGLPAAMEPLDLFIGFAVRVEVLMKLEMYAQNLEEIKAVYGVMAEATGTIWEHRQGIASLNHGFGSFIAVRILDCLRKLGKLEE